MEGALSKGAGSLLLKGTTSLLIRGAGVGLMRQLASGALISSAMGRLSQGAAPIALAGGRAFSASAAAGASEAKYSFFSHVPMAPKDPILGVTEAFQCDMSTLKINLGVGAYRDDHGQPVVLESVREAEQRVAGSHFMEYLPIGGKRQFCEYSVALAYGEDAKPVREKSVAMVQALSGTGACRLFAEFQRRWMPGQVYIPDPTWANHLNIFRDAGVTINRYPYYDPKTRGLDFEGMCRVLAKAPPGSTVVLHACAHNPTGVDPTPEQWAELSKLFSEHRLFPMLDMAYQGFASGDCERDALALRIFLEDGHRMALAQSFAKNMGLYGQRVGCFSMICGSEAQAQSVESQIKAIARPMYSNPPLHGALLVTTILADDKLKQLWFGEVKEMADRIQRMRRLLRQNLEDLGSPLPWNHITDQIGMFCYTGLTPEQVDTLQQDEHVYMTRNGRISLAGVTTGNVERLAKAIHRVTSGECDGKMLGSHARQGWFHATP